jgi:hypothetical protein
LWYVLAAANALSGDSELIAGTQLRVPELGVSKNDASTFKPYNPNKIVGSTSPSLPYIPPQSSNGCGYIITAVVLIAAAVFVPYLAPIIGPAATGVTAAAGAVAGATLTGTAVATGLVTFAAHAAATAVGSAMGLATFSWKQSLGQGIAAGLTAGLAGGLGTTSELLGKFASNPSWIGAGKIAASAVGGALANYAGYEIAGVKGNSFSWKSIAASAVANVVTAAIGNKLNLAPKYEGGIITTGDFAKDFAYGAIGGVVSLHTRRAFGFNDKVDYGDIALNAFATAVGNATGRSIAKSIEMNKAQKNSQLLTDEQYNDMMDRRFWLASNDNPISILDNWSNPVMEAGGLYSTASEEENPYLGKEGLPGINSNGVVCEAPKIVRKSNTRERFESVMTYLIDAADSAGVDVGLLVEIAGYESDFAIDARPIAKNPNRNNVKQFDGVMAISSAHGLGQLLDDAWTDSINKYGSKYGIENAGNLSKSQAAQYRADVRIQAAMLAEFTKVNIEIGRDIGGADDSANVYALHNLGIGGGKKFLKIYAASPNSKVNQHYSEKVISGNSSLYGDGSISIKDAYQNMSNAMARNRLYAEIARNMQREGK